MIPSVSVKKLCLDCRNANLLTHCASSRSERYGRSAACRAGSCLGRAYRPRSLARLSSTGSASGSALSWEEVLKSSDLARPAGFEPATRCLEGSRSIHLSYGRLSLSVHGKDHMKATPRSQCTQPSEPYHPGEHQPSAEVTRSPRVPQAAVIRGDG
jgi:hypothetical protein